MANYVALLRGINVGGNHKVAMPKLKEVFESLGFSDVSTYINTGNVIFETDMTDTARVVEIIETALHKNFGFTIPTVVRTATDIHKLCKALPEKWENNDGQKTDILFLWDAYSSKKSLALIHTTPADTLLYTDGAIVWHVEKKDYAHSGMHTFVESAIYKNMTARNINTVRKLGELLG